MALFVKPTYTSTREWARNALSEAGVPHTRVYRVFAPIDVTEDDATEVLFLDEKGHPCRAWVKVDGHVSLVTDGW